MSVSTHFKRFARNTSGNVSLFFALSVTSLMTAGGVAIDYSKASSAKSALSSSADSAALAGARTRGDAATREAAARSVFEANLRSAGYTGPVSVVYRNLTTSGTNSGFRVEASGSVRSWFGAVTGNADAPIASAAQATSGGEEPIEIVFVLDTTDSMEGDRIVNLKSAALNVIDEINRRSPRPGLVKVGVVPFAQYVNVGMANRSASWIDVRADYQEPIVTTCSMQFPVVGSTNCRTVHYPATPAVPPSACTRDGRPRMCGGSPAYPASSANVCDPVYGTTAVNVCTNSGGNWVRWDGCVGSRPYPLETMDSRYDVKIPGILGLSCATPIQNLTTDLSSVRSTISGLVTMGETYLPAGIIWGWRMLSPGEPLNAATVSGTGTKKFMILVTDGRNTKSPNYPMHEGNDSVQADQLTRETCANLARDRANPIQMSSVAFEVDGLDVKRILQDCARNTGGQFYDATNADRLRDAFSQIIDSVFTVRLTH
jgi:Mg-chelatase subunit ChlD